MQILPFILNGQKLKKGVGFPDVVEKSKEYLKMSVSGIDRSLSYTAYFTLSWENNKVYSIPMSNGECVIDEYITTIPENPSDYYDYKVSVSVVGVGADGSRSTSNFVDIILGKSNYSGETTNTPEIPQSQYEAFVSAVAESASKAESSVSTAETIRQSCAELQERTARDATLVQNAVPDAAAQVEMAKSKAEEAAASSEAATNAWSDAAEASSAAVSAKNAAEVARDEAVSAKNQAVLQKNAAQKHKEDAEAAAGEAKDTLEEIRNVVGSVQADVVGSIVNVEYVDNIQNKLTVEVTGVADPTSVTVKCLGKNVIPLPYYDDRTTINGVTFTVNEDGSISLSGTATAFAKFSLADISSSLGNGLIKLPIKKSFYISGGLSNSIYLQVSDRGGTQTVTDKGTGNIIVTNATEYRVLLCVTTGTNVDGITVQPMMEFGNSATGYETYSCAEYTPNANGVVENIPSINADKNIPVSTIMTDSDTAVVTVKFTKTAKGAIEELRNPWKGLKWAAIGDSITAATEYTDVSYHDYIAKETGITVVNMGMSGTGYKHRENVNNAFYQRASKIPADSDVVTIFGSGNDYSVTDYVIGNADDSGTDTLCGCVNTAIDTVFSVSPTVRLGIITSIPWSYLSPISDTTFLEDYSNAIVSVCRRRGIPCLDLFHCSGLRPWDAAFIEAVYTKDAVDENGNKKGIHPNEIGHAMIAPKIKSFLDTLIL